MDQNPKSSNLSHLAIDATLDSRWNDALKFNRQIIKLDPQNVDALNRQAHIYMEMDRCNLAKKYYLEVVKIDPYNPIALKNLKIIKSFKPGVLASRSGQKRVEVSVNGNSRLSPTLKLNASLFLQEPGKTKIVNLLKVAEPQKLSKAYCGMQVSLIIKNRKITIVDAGGNYLGILPDDTSYHLLRLLRGGNRYNLFIKSIRVNGLSVLIKETYRSKRFKNQPSFLDSSESSITPEIYTALDTSGGEEEETDEEEAVI